VIDFFLSLDQKLFLILNSWHFAWLNPFMSFLSGQLIWIPFLLIVLLVSKKQLDQKSFALFALFFILALMGSDVTSSYILKNIFTRLRPCRLEELKPLIHQFGQKCGGKFGFVSSHAANSFCLIAFSLSTLTFRTKKMYYLWLLPLMVSYSRIYLGSHYPGDILGGALVGSFWGIGLGRLFKNNLSWGQTA
jgi:undecaprenyl-diphosphatase